MHKKNKILLVEDNKIDLMAFQRFVAKSDLPYDFECVGSVAEAQAILEIRHFDVILLDYFIGDGTAFDLSKKLSETPFIIITGSGDEETAVTAMKTGAYDYLIKDTEGNYLKTLPVTVENALKRKRIEDELNSYREHLEELIVVQTAELRKEIEERKKTEVELLKSRETAHALLNAPGDPAFLIDTEGIILAVNDAGVEFFKLSQSRLIGSYVYDHIPKEVKKSRIEKIQQVFEAGKPLRFEEKYLDRVHVHNFYPIANKEGKIEQLAAFIRDVTEARQAEQEKEKMREQLLHSQKMEAIGILAGGIAHDFNNILQGIIAYDELILSKIADNGNLKFYADEILKSSESATSLTRQLLTFSRKQINQPKIMDLTDTLSNLEKMLRRILEEDINLNTRVQEQLYSIKADPGQMEQVIMNLIVNAKDAVGDGGTISVDLSNVFLDEEHVKSNPEAYSGYFVRLVIEDNGVGMDDDVKGKVFEPFFSQKRSGRGTGLGLSTVHGIVKQHEGWIEVESRKQVGTKFNIYLPALPDADASPAQSKMHLSQFKNGTGERILVVEDNKKVREVITIVLEEKGYNVVGAGKIEEAATIFEQEKGQVDLVFSDVVLPDGSGVVMISKFLEQNPHVKVLFSSGYTEVKSQWNIIQEKGFDFLQKPYSLNELLSLITGLLK